MNVIEKIESGALEATIKFIDRSKHEIVWCQDELKELLQLAKLGKAALEAVESGSTCACMDIHKTTTFTDVCSENDECVWSNFCKLRSEVQP